MRLAIQILIDALIAFAMFLLMTTPVASAQVGCIIIFCMLAYARYENSKEMEDS